MVKAIPSGVHPAMAKQPDSKSGRSVPPLDGSAIPIVRPEVQAHGTVKTDHYWTGDNKNQVITTVETPPVNVGGATVTAAVGKDRRVDTSPKDERNVVDVNVKVPIAPNVAIKGRSRTSTGQGNPKSQFRAGVEVSAPITKNTSVYVQGYAADTVMKGGHTHPAVGAFAGVSHRISENTSVYAEGQVYKGHDVHREDVGVNVGLRLSF